MKTMGAYYHTFYSCWFPCCYLCLNKPSPKLSSRKMLTVTLQKKLDAAECWCTEAAEVVLQKSDHALCRNPACTSCALCYCDPRVDWRSPGEAWVKTDEGWEKKKVLEHARALRQSDDSEPNKNESSSVQPYCHITIKCTKEIAGFNELDEVVKKLDFRNAVRDVRRFNYICALLDLLVGQQMTALSGCTQKVLLAMLEEVATYATANQHNPRTLRRLLTKLRALSNAEQSACWGGPLGSRVLWNQHSLTIKRIQANANNFQIREPLDETCPNFLQLPEECIREVVLRLSDHKDLASTSEVCDELTAIVNEKRVWRELTRFHFTKQQIDLIKAKHNKTDWKEVYHALIRCYGLNEDRQYAEMLSLCRYCRCLFWRSLGHPCIADQCPEFRARLQEAGGIAPPSPVPPSAFLKFFSL